MLSGCVSDVEVISELTNLTEEGYFVNFGNSFAMTLEFTESGPHAEAVMTYSQSEHAGSEYLFDQTEPYALGEFRDCLFTSAEIASDPVLVTETLRF